MGLARIAVALWIALAAGCKDDPAPTPPDEPLVFEPGDCVELGLTPRHFDVYGPYGIGRGAVAGDFAVPTTRGDWHLRQSWTGCDVYVFIPDEDPSTAQWPVGLWERDLEALLDDSPRNARYFFYSTKDDALDVVTALEQDVVAVLDEMDEVRRAWWADRLHFVTDIGALIAGWVPLQVDATGYGFVIDRSQQIRDLGSLSDWARFDETMQWFEPNLAYVANEVVYANHLADLEARLAAEVDTLVLSGLANAPMSGSLSFDLAFPSAISMAEYDTVEYDLTLTCEGDAEAEACPAWSEPVLLYQCDTPADDVNLFENVPCQAYVAPVQEQPEKLGTCYINGVPSELDCVTTEDCDESPDDSSDTGIQPVLWCLGYSPGVEGVDEVPAEELPCDCDAPDGSTYTSVQICNDKGSGYGACDCTCDSEVGRWQTPYGREGRWVHDATPILAFLQDGGTRPFEFYTGQQYTVSLDLRLSNTGRLARVTDAAPLFTGGTFDADYNSKYDALQVPIPVEAVQVDLVVLVSGQGFGTDEANCAEFCNHTHHFTINGVEHVRDHPHAGIENGCVDDVADGMVPNQFGPWFYGRGGWCPGQAVVPWVVDVTDLVTPGENATVTYEARLAGDPYLPVPVEGSGTAARIDLLSYLAFSR